MYYDPEIGRFILTDSVDYLDPTTINGLNLYAYCYNDPINWYDDCGYKPKRINGNNSISKGWTWRIDRGIGKTLKHIHVDKNNGNFHYSQNVNGKPHDKLAGNSLKWVRDYLRNNGIWDWKNQFVLNPIPIPSILPSPLIQSNNTISLTPIIRDNSIIENIPTITDSFTYESFSLQESGKQF